MKFSCKTSELLQAIQLVGRAIGSQQTLPILGNILFVVEGKRCTVSATDLELSIVSSFEAEVENEGSITLPAKAIVNFAQYNSNPTVLFETVEGTQMRCTSKHARTMISGEAAGEYPTISSLKKETSFSLPAGPLLTALNKVTFASAKASLRPVLSGVYIRAEKGKLIFVATDSYRLSEYSIDAHGAGEDISCIAPTKVLEELKLILGIQKTDAKGKKKDDAEKEMTVGDVHISLSSQQIELRVGHTTLLSRLIEGNFPNYQQIIPKEENTQATLSTNELLTVVKRMHYFAKEVNNNLTFDIKKEGGIHINTPQTQLGRDEAELGAAVTGAEGKIALSSTYLLDFLNHADDDVVVLTLTDSLRPAVFRLPNNPNYLHLIMPLRLQD